MARRRRRKSSRLRQHDYSSPGWYFVTLVCQNRISFFGTVNEASMDLNAAGRMASGEWLELDVRFPYLRVGAYIVMPNHLHGILQILPVERGLAKGEHEVRPYGEPGPPLDAAGAVGSCRGDPCDRPLRGEKPLASHPSGTLPHSLGRFIQAFKSITTLAYIRHVDCSSWPAFPGRLWQRNYYDRIIRSMQELQRLETYIAENPAGWNGDSFYGG